MLCVHVWVCAGAWCDDPRADSKLYKGNGTLMVRKPFAPTQYHTGMDALDVIQTKTLTIHLFIGSSLCWTHLDSNIAIRMHRSLCKYFGLKKGWVM